MEIVSPPEQVDMARNKKLLNRYRFIEYETIRILAGWLPATANMELKLAMGRLLWEDAQHVQYLYRRLREVQTPAFQSPGDEALEHLLAEMIHAPNELDLLAGIFRVVKPALVAAYRWHMTQTFANPDAPTLYAFKHILVDEVEQLAWAEETLATHPAGEWETYIAALLTAAGGVTGDEARAVASEIPACRTLFVAPKTAARDGRFTIQAHKPGSGGAGSENKSRRQLEFESYSQEMLAAETCALVLYESPKMPWAFVYDTARHCYDEARHCMLGIEWMARHGMDYTAVPQNTRIYEWRSQYDPATQYCLLTRGNEAHVFPFRHESLALYEASGDQLSAQFVSYDMADERQHVAYGTKWLPKLMKSHGIDTDVDTFIEETVAMWQAEYVSGALPLHAQNE